jgi:hypothetical protein
MLDLSEARIERVERRPSVRDFMRTSTDFSTAAAHTRTSHSIA